MIMIQLTDHSSSTDAAVGEVMLKKCGGRGSANLDADRAYDKSTIYKLL